MRLKPAFDGLDVVYVGRDPSAAVDVPGHRYYTVSDITRKNKWMLPVILGQLLRILIVERPGVVITTGAAPALFGLIMAKWFLGARTIWVDSIANVDEMSTSGVTAGRFVDVWLTQWPHLAAAEGPGRRPEFWGAVL